MVVAVDPYILLGEIIFVIAVTVIFMKIFGIENLNFLFDQKEVNSTSMYLIYPRISPPTRISNSTVNKIEGNISDTQKYKLHSWLENLTSHYTRYWIESQRKCYHYLLSQEKYSKRIKLLTNKFQKYFNNGIKIVYAPYQRGKFYFYYKKDKIVNQTNSNYSIDAAADCQPSLFFTNDIRKEGKLLLDCKRLISCYGLVLRGTWLSDDGYKLAYGISKWYRDSYTTLDMEMSIFVRDVLTGDDSSIDILRGLRADLSTIAWLEGHIGFFYTRYYYESLDTSQSDNSSSNNMYENKLHTSISNLDLAIYSTSSSMNDLQTPSSNINEINSSNEKKFVLGVARIYFHRIKTSQEDDLLIFEDTEAILHQSKKSYTLRQGSSSIPYKVLTPIVSQDGHYLIIEEFNQHVSSRVPICQQSINDENGSPCPGNMVHYRDLSIFDGRRLETLGPLHTLIDSLEYRFDYIVNLQDRFWFRTNYLAPAFRVVQINVPVSDSNWPFISNSSTFTSPIISKSRSSNQTPTSNTPSSIGINV